MADNTNLAYISQITLPSGTTYKIKDSEVREQLALLSQDLTGALVFVGITETAIADGDATATIKVNGADHNAEVGDVVIYGKKEFVFTSSNIWVELGDFGDLKAQLGELAYLNSAQGSYTPAGNVALTVADYEVTSTGSAAISGTISQPVFTGEKDQAINVAGEAQFINSITSTFTGTEDAVSVSGSVTAAGEISKPEFKGTGATITSEGLYTPEGDIAVTVQSENVQVTSAGSIDQISGVNSTFTGETNQPITVSGNCLPVGTVSAPEINVTAGTDSHTSWTGEVSNETLIFSAATATYVNSVEAALAEAPVFTGQNSNVSASGVFTAKGTIANTYDTATANISVTGTVQKVTGAGATFTGKEKSVSVQASYTPTGEVTKPTFTGSAVNVSAAGVFTPKGNIASTFTTSARAIAASGVFTASGTVSTPTFTGNTATLSVKGVVPTAKSAAFTGTEATITVSKPASA
jgi:hypothetical protein